MEFVIRNVNLEASSGCVKAPRRPSGGLLEPSLGPLGASWTAFWGGPEGGMILNIILESCGGLDFFPPQFLEALSGFQEPPTGPTGTILG